MSEVADAINNLSQLPPEILAQLNALVTTVVAGLAVYAIFRITGGKR